MYVVFRRYIDAEVVSDLLRGVHGFVSYCLHVRRREEPVAVTVCGSQTGTEESNRRAAERNEAATSISVPEIIIEEDPCLQF